MTRPQDRVGNLRQQLAEAERQLEREQTTCKHEWGKVKYVPNYQPAYCIPSDKERELQMGVDSQGCHVSAKTTPKWQKTCPKCGLTLVTETTKKEHVSGKIDGCGGQQNVPNFTHAQKVRCDSK